MTHLVSEQFARKNLFQLRILVTVEYN